MSDEKAERRLFAAPHWLNRLKEQLLLSKVSRSLAQFTLMNPFQLCYKGGITCNCPNASEDFCASWKQANVQPALFFPVRNCYEALAQSNAPFRQKTSWVLVLIMATQNMSKHAVML